MKQIRTKKPRASQGSLLSPYFHPTASAMLKHKDETRIGRATNPEPMIPRANNGGPSSPIGASASAACRVVIDDGSATCMCDAAIIADSEMNTATAQPYR